MMEYACNVLSNDYSSLLIRFRWRDKDDVLAIILSRLWSHPVVHWQRSTDHASAQFTIASLVLSVFMTIAQVKLVALRDEGGDNDFVMYHTIVGPSSEKSRVLDATVLMDIPATRDMITILNRGRSDGLVVALFECSLELSGGSERQNIELTAHSADTGLHGTSAERQLLDDFATMLQRSHVRLVCCQKRVHPYLVRKLRAMDIVCISRVSVKYMGALMRITGARQLATIPTLSNSTGVLDPCCLGYVRSARYEHLFGRPFVAVQGFDVSVRDDEVDIAGDRIKRIETDLLRRLEHLPRDFREPFVGGVVRRVRCGVTVVVTAHTETAAALWQTAVEDCIIYLRRLSSERPVILPGKGIWLAGLARSLRGTLRPPLPDLSRVSRHTNAAERIFINCLENCAVMSGGSRAHRRQLSPDGEGWGNSELFEQFQTPTGTASESDAPAQLIFRSPDKSSVAVLCERSSSVAAESSHELCTYRLDTTRVATPPLDSWTGSTQAMRVATEMACALLDVDDIICVTSSS